MACTLATLQDVLVWLVVAIVILSLLKLLLTAITGVAFWPLVQSPWAMTNPAGVTGFVVAALNIIIWGVLMLALIYFVFMMLGCLLSFTGGFHFPRGGR